MKKSVPFVGDESASKLVVSAELCAARFEWTAAEAFFREAMSRDSTPSSRIAYGVCLSQQERYFEAISVFTPVLDSTNRSAIGVVCHNLAAIYRNVGDLDLARRFQWRATLLQDDLGSEDLLGMANEAITEELYEVAGTLVIAASETDDDAETVEADGDLVATEGLISAVLDSAQDGIVTLFSAYRCHRAARDFRGMGSDLLNMALLFGELKRFRAEERFILRAIRSFKRAPAPFSLNRALCHLEAFNRRQSVRDFDSRRN